MPLRKTSKGLEAPTDVYVNRHGQEITLIGVMHVAEQHFWSKLTHKLLNTQGTIHLEGVKPFAGDKDKLSKETIQKIETLIKIASFSRILASETGLVFQKEGILAELPNGLENTGWLNVDLDVHSAVKNINAEELTKTSDSFDKLYTEFQKEDAPFSLGDFMLFMIRNPKLLKLIAFVTKITTKDKDAALGALEGFILDERNKYAIKEALKVKGNVTLVWGAAHLEGMGKLLRQSGYRHKNRSWDLLIRKEFRSTKKKASAKV
jgi:hypothetical protein